MNLAKIFSAFGRGMCARRQYWLMEMAGWTER